MELEPGDHHNESELGVRLWLLRYSSTVSEIYNYESIEDTIHITSAMMIAGVQPFRVTPVTN